MFEKIYEQTFTTYFNTLLKHQTKSFSIIIEVLNLAQIIQNVQKKYSDILTKENVRLVKTSMYLQA